MAIKKWPVCQVCGKEVTTEEGFLAIYHDELMEYKKQSLEWEKKHPLDENVGRIIDATDIMEMPESVQWHWGHSECLGDSMYDIPYSRFDTLGKVLSWTLHLMEKSWLDYTDWETAVCTHYKIPNA
jgi:hypothetical protein